MTSIFSVGQSISSIGKSMTAIARVEEHLATFMKKVIYFEKFFQRMGPNLPICVMDTATLLFQRCYEYRDEIRDELESSVAYVADAGRWVVGVGDWNSKMEKRLNQVSELVLLANTLLTEYAVTGKVGADGCRDELIAYLQILAATVTLKNAPVNGKARKMITTSDDRPPIAQIQSTTAAEFNSEMSALGTEIAGAFSEMFGNNDFDRSVSSGTIGQTPMPQDFDTDNDAMNPFADSYGRSVDSSVKGMSSASASVTSSEQRLLDTTLAGVSASAAPEYPPSDENATEGPLSPVSMGEYECLETNSIPKYAAFKSSAQLAARRQYAPGSGNGSLAATMTRRREGNAYSDTSTEYNELFPLPPFSAHTVSNYLSPLDTHAVLEKKLPVKPILDMNYSYDFNCEVAHNPFLSPNSLGPYEGSSSVTSQQKFSSSEQQPGRSNNTQTSTLPTSTMMTPGLSAAQDQTHSSVSLAATLLDPLVAENEVETVSPPPTLHEAIDYAPAMISGSVTCTQSSNLSNGNSAVKANGSKAVVVVTSNASAAEHEHHDSDHEYDLFRVGNA